ncbi:hypothetical protein EV359DRAFT_60529 [Lentinula novae-zelandiae]|nr:hypothetical protein EV359DRAFT_60529 [Lentinula novae-zelandiae]
MPTFASIADLLASPFELDFPCQYASLGRIRISEISFQSDEHETESRTVYSVYPSLIEDLQALYVPTISNYIDIDKDTLARLEGKVIEAAQRLRAKPLSMSLTMNALQFVWAFVPVKQDLSRVPSSSSTSSGTSSEFWDHCEEPTIFFSPILDILLRKCSSWEERFHVLAQGIIVCCIELGHLFPRFIYGNDARRIPESNKLQWSSRVDGCIGEGGEWVEEQITGGTHFSILNSIENIEHLASAQPNQPHGFRISGQSLRSGHNKEVVIEDERVSAFLRYFLKEDENDMIVIPLLPNSRWSDYLDHSVPLHSKRHYKSCCQNHLFPEMIWDLHSRYRRLYFLFLPQQCQQGLRMEVTKESLCHFLLVIIWRVFELHKLHEPHGLNAKLKLKHWLNPQVINRWPAVLDKQLGRMQRRRREYGQELIAE